MLMITTETVIGYEIQEYLGYISETVTLGINDFMEFFQISDTFGGESSSYKNKFDEAKDILNKRLEKKAVEMQGNGIIGLRIGYQEITGKGKSSILISGTGTVVKLDIPEDKKREILEKEQQEKMKNEKNLSQISIEEIAELSINDLINKLENTSADEQRAIKYFALKREDVTKGIEKFSNYETSLLEKRTQYYDKTAKLILLLRKIEN